MGALPSAIRCHRVAETTLKQGVVFVPGEYFFSDKPDRSTFRLSFATATEQQMQEAVARLRRSL